MKKTLVRSLAMAFVGSLLMAGSALAIPELDFNISAHSPSVGQISYAGGLAPLIGTGILVDDVTGLDTPSNDGILFNLIGGVLNFTTGPSTGTSGSPLGAGYWGGGASSFITLTGGVDVNGDGDALDVGDIATTTLMTGNFGTASVSYDGTTFHVAAGAFTDFKDPSLLDLYGMPKFKADESPLPYLGGFNISFRGTFDVDGEAFTSTSMRSGDIVNLPTPEPATMLLLGTGLVGLAGARRRKATKK